MKPLRLLSARSVPVRVPARGFPLALSRVGRVLAAAALATFALGGIAPAAEESAGPASSGSAAHETASADTASTTTSATASTTTPSASEGPGPSASDPPRGRELPPGIEPLLGSDPARPSDRVFVIPLHGPIENSLYFIVARAIRAAEREGARAIILDLDTEGGRVDSAIRIRDLLVRTKIRSFAYVNNRAISAGAFLALAAERIVMSPVSNIGAALPITVGPEGATAADRKFISYFASEMRKTASHRGHSPEIAEGFSDPDVVIPGLKEKGDLLTLIDDEATSVGLAAYVAEDLEDLLARERLDGATIVRFHETPTDRLARVLSHPMLQGVLLLVGLGGIFLEMKTPGFGLPGSVGVLAMLVFFFGSYLANLSGYMTGILFFVGVGLLLVELFLIPGFGVTGIAGILLMVGSAFFAMFNFAPEGFAFRTDSLLAPLMTLLVSLFGLVPLLYLVSRIGPQTRTVQRMVLHGDAVVDPVEVLVAPERGPRDRSGGGVPEATSAAASGASDAPARIRPGARGRAVSDLRPGGFAILEGRRVDVSSQGEYIERGAEIEVAKVAGDAIFVRPASPPDERA